MSFDVIIPIEVYDPSIESDNQNVHVKLLNDEGITVIHGFPKNMEYDVLYSAYSGHSIELAKYSQFKYHVRLPYGLSGGNKPNLFKNHANYVFYDFMLSYGGPDVAISSAHIKTYPVGNINMANFKRDRATPNDKKTLLYMPTWGDVSSINENTLMKLIELKSKYYVTVKTHDIVTKWEGERGRNALVNSLKDSFDKLYSTNARNDIIFNNVDVVLSDISAAAFDAVACDIPVALFGFGEPVYYGGKLCFHQQLVKDDIIPGTNDVNELESVIEKALTPEYFSKQQELKKEMFPFEGKECLYAFMRFQDDLFNDRVDTWYIAARRAIRENYINEQRETRERYEAAVETGIRAVEATKQEYETSNSWKLTKPIRALSKLIKSQE